MDPQKLSQLDPKLRDAYERVMGIAIPQPQAAPTQAQTPPSAGGSTAPYPNPIPTPQPAPIADTQPTMNPQSEPIPMSQPIPAQQASDFVRMNSEMPAPTPNFSAFVPQTMVSKKKNGIMTPILFGIVGLIFIIIYTLFWTKIFNFKLPFLP